MSYENPRSTTNFSNLASDVPQVGERASAPFSRRRRNRRCPGRKLKKYCAQGISASPWFAASCCCIGSLAVISRSGSRNLESFHQCLKGVAATPTCGHPRNIKAELRDGSVLMEQRWLQQVHKLLIMYQTRQCEPASIRCAVSERCKKCKDEVSGRLPPAAAQDTTKAVVWRPLPLSPAPTLNQAGNTRATSSGSQTHDWEICA